MPSGQGLRPLFSPSSSSSSGGGSAPARFAAPTQARVPATTGTTVILPNALRAYFLICNMSAANLFLTIGTGVVTTPGSEHASIVLPPNAFVGYEILNYSGDIQFAWDADDAGGYALVTQAFYAA